MLMDRLDSVEKREGRLVRRRLSMPWARRILLSSFSRAKVTVRAADIALLDFLHYRMNRPEHVARDIEELLTSNVIKGQNDRVVLSAINAGMRVEIVVNESPIFGVALHRAIDSFSAKVRPRVIFAVRVRLVICSLIERFLGPLTHVLFGAQSSLAAGTGQGVTL